MQIFSCGKNKIVCQSEITRYGFRHIATLVYGACEDKTSVAYYNRTWERFKYQTVMLKLIDKTTALTNRQKAVWKKKLNKIAI